MLNQLTILTPTYNRADKISKLYNSLVSQKEQGFTWLIIDDGSTDNTKEVINSLRIHAPFKIKYFYKENGGKVSAHKLGFKKLETKWCMAIDSDDWLLKGSLNTINDLLNKNNESLDALCFHRYDPINNKIIGNRYPKGIRNYIDLYNSGVKGDKVHIHRSNVLKNIDIKLFPPERYISIFQVFLEFGSSSNIKCYNIPITACVYLKSGLTSNITLNRYKSPKGTSYTYKTAFQTKCLNKRIKWRAKINYYRFGSAWNIKLISYNDMFLYAIGLLYFYIDKALNKDIRELIKYKD